MFSKECLVKISKTVGRSACPDGKGVFNEYYSLQVGSKWFTAYRLGNDRHNSAVELAWLSA